MPHDHADPERAGQLHHVELNVANFDAVIDFWEWFFGHLGYEPKDKWDGGRSWVNGPTYIVLGQTDSGPPIDRETPGLDHLAFHAASRDQVDAITDGVRGRSDASVLYEDRHPYAGGYYALYCEAPEGVTVEVVGPE